jgi:hypothetical protein
MARDELCVKPGQPFFLFSFFFRVSAGLVNKERLERKEGEEIVLKSLVALCVCVCVHGCPDERARPGRRGGRTGGRSSFDIEKKRKKSVTLDGGGWVAPAQANPFGLPNNYDTADEGHKSVQNWSRDFLFFFLFGCCQRGWGDKRKGIK